MKILVFTEGTVIMHSEAFGVNRVERVRQSVLEIPSVKDFRTYIPNGNAVRKLQNWKSQGATIYYLTSREDAIQIEDIKFVLSKNNFPDYQNLLFRKVNQQYKDVAEDLLPDIFIEDDCESIGGQTEMTYPHVRNDIKNKIHSIVVNEFGGIDYLPDNLSELLKSQ